MVIMTNPSNLTDQAIAKACCADLYQSDVARLVLGDSLHPGGLALTNRLARLMGVQAGDWVLDLASGRGVSAMAVSRVFHCNVVGVEFGAISVAESWTKSNESPSPPTCFFIRGDAERPPIRSGSFDGVFCECSMSLFMDKGEAVAEITKLLRAGGRFGLSDVALAPGALPPELDGTIGQLLCLSDALDVHGYLSLLEGAGLEVVQQEDSSAEIVKILDQVEGKLAALDTWMGLSPPEVQDSGVLDTVPQVMTTLRAMVASGDLGYWLFVAQKPG